MLLLLLLCPPSPPVLDRGPDSAVGKPNRDGGHVDVRDVDGRRMENVVGIDGDE